MITDLFTSLTEALTGQIHLAVIAAASWGILSILLSPCHLSSIPLIIGYMNQQDSIVHPRRAFTLSVSFALGILITIIVVGLVTAALGRLMGDMGSVGNWIVGILLIFIGLYLMDIVPLRWGGFALGRFQKVGAIGAFVLGLVFGFGIGPCTFAFMAPVLGVVFQTAGREPFLAFMLLLAFAIGHVAVIVLAGTLASWVQQYLNWQAESRTVRVLRRLCGFLVFLGGVYLIYLS
ncbi:MAG: cytochrome c biogenesis protein CcdA [Bacteroidota bacterium]